MVRKHTFSADGIGIVSRAVALRGSARVLASPALLGPSGGMADALASGASVLRDVGVQVPPRTLHSKEVGLDADAPAALRSSIGNRYVPARNSDQSNFRAVFSVRMLTMPLRLTASIERSCPEVWLTSAPRPVWPRRADRCATACLLSVTAGLLKTSLMRLARSLAETGYRD